MLFKFGSKQKQQKRLTEASRRLAVAEGELTAAMAELTRTDRADKQIVGDRLRVALAELITARCCLTQYPVPAL